MDGDSARAMLAKLGGDWRLERSDHDYLEKTYRFKNFAQGLDFVNRVGSVAERENHHPDVYLAWGRVTLSVWTHSVKGLTENDFDFAAKCDEAFAQ